MVAPWNETTLPTLLSKYDLNDIFNADEFGLLYQCLPSKIYHFNGQTCSGGKNSKVRLTGMAAGNTIGEKLPMFVIGKSKTLRPFNHIQNLPCKYKSQKKSWMDSQIFEEWLRKLDRTFRMERRKIPLLIDNSPAHPAVSDLKNVHLVFLPPNTTSLLQLMDQGVIKSLKVHYLGRVVRRLCRALDKTKTLSKTSILQTMKILVSSWEAVSAQIIVNCFRKAGITLEAQNAAITDADDPFSDLKESLQQLHDIDPDMVPESVTPESLIDADNEVITTAPVITDDDILRSATTNQQEQSDEDDDNEEEVEEVAPERPLSFQVGSAIDVIRNAALYSSNGEEFEKLSTSLKSYSLKIELHPRNKKIFVTFSNPFDCNVVIVKLLKFFKETVKTIKTLCNVSVNF